MAERGKPYASPISLLVRTGESGDARTENWAVRCEAKATERRAAANMNF